MKRVDVAIALVVRSGSVLICRRLPDAPLGGLWEFPGGKVEPGEDAERCAVREVMEEVGITISARRALDAIEYEYPGARIRLHPFICSYVAGEARPLGCAQALWVSPNALDDYQFPPANDSLLAEIKACLAHEFR